VEKFEGTEVEENPEKIITKQHNMRWKKVSISKI